MLFILAKSLPYIEKIITLRNIIILNRLINQSLKKRIYKKALAFPKLPIKIRSEIWKHSIFDKSLIELYTEIKEERMTKYLVSGKVSKEIISMDVDRSFHLYDNKTQEVIYL